MRLALVDRVKPFRLPTTHPVRAEVSKPLVTANRHPFRLSLSKPSPIGAGFRQAQPERILVDAKKRFDTSARTVIGAARTKNDLWVIERVKPGDRPRCQRTSPDCIRATNPCAVRSTEVAQ